METVEIIVIIIAAALRSVFVLRVRPTNLSCVAYTPRRRVI